VKYLGSHHQVLGARPLKLGHIAHAVEDQAMADFYCRVLGFRVSDWIEDYFVFLRCNPDHHR
jgi:catechol 2,3-dioxygenase-like lactoylglutathione lyase family enzyme